MSKSTKAAPAAVAKPRAQAAAVAQATKTAKAPAKAPPPAKVNGQKSPAAPGGKGKPTPGQKVAAAVARHNKRQADNAAAVAAEAQRQAEAGVVNEPGTISIAAMAEGMAKAKAEAFSPPPADADPLGKIGAMPSAGDPELAEREAAEEEADRVEARSGNAPPNFKLQADEGWAEGVTFKDPAWKDDKRFVHVQAVTRAIRRLSPEIGIKLVTTLVPSLSLCNIAVDRCVALTVAADGTFVRGWAEGSSGHKLDITTAQGAEAAARAALDQAAGRPATYKSPVSGAPRVDVADIAAAVSKVPGTSQPVAEGMTLKLVAPVTPGFDLYSEIDVGGGDIFRLEAHADAYQVRKANTEGDPEGDDFKVVSWALLAKGLETPSAGLRAMASEIERLDGRAIAPDPEEVAKLLFEVAGALRKFDENTLAQRCRWMAHRVRGQDPKDDVAELPPAISPADLAKPARKGKAPKPQAQPARVATARKVAKAKPAKGKRR